MSGRRPPPALVAAEAPPRRTPSNYPEPFASRMAGREKRALGELFGLANFGVNLTRLAPGAVSALRHAHATQDEFIYVLEGHPVLVTDAGETPLAPGMCAGIRAGSGDAHHLVNRSAPPAIIGRPSASVRHGGGGGEPWRARRAPCTGVRLQCALRQCQSARAVLAAARHRAR